MYRNRINEIRRKAAVFVAGVFLAGALGACAGQTEGVSSRGSGADHEENERAAGTEDAGDTDSFCPSAPVSETIMLRSWSILAQLSSA